MEAIMNRSSSRRATLRGSCGMAVALAGTVFSGIAHGQAFQGPGNVTSGAAGITTGAGTTNISVGTPEVVIDWTPVDFGGTGAIDFLPTGTTATYNTAVGANFPDYTVLNRILPLDVNGAPVTSTVAFNGLVQSFAQGEDGGNIWFYSPTGIIAGGGSVFNVGSLVLTTNDIDTTGGLYGAVGEIRFRGSAGSTGFINVASSVNGGAQLNALDPSGGYVALVAPRVVQGGTINSSGQIALVAAEQADIVINAGLLDIFVTQGTTDPNGIVHTGTSTGPASVSLADTQVIQMIAMPKNTALTMLLSGSIGYAPAAVVTDDGSAIVLSAGFGPGVPTPVLAQGLGNMTVGNTVFSNKLFAVATNTVDIQPTLGGTVRFQSDADLLAGRVVNAIAERSETIQADANLYLTAGLFENGGTANVVATSTTPAGLPPAIPAGRIIVADTFIVDASAQQEFTNSPPANGVNALGGDVFVTASGGTISATSLNVAASGFGGDGLANGGNGTGGNIRVATSLNGSITSGTLNINAEGGGGFGPALGGNGTGGSAQLLDLGGTLAFSDVGVSVRGFGRESDGIAGNATGGSVLIDITSRPQNWSSLDVDASAIGGTTLSAGSASGSATGGAGGITLHVINPAALNISGSVSLHADATVGINGPVGYSATGGSVAVDVSGGILDIGNGLEVSATAGFNVEAFSPSPNSTAAMQGGSVNVFVVGGTISAMQLLATSAAEGAGAITRAGTVTGGTARVAAQGGGVLSVTNPDGGAPVNIDANAYGGNGPAPAHAFGGTAQLFVSDAALDFTDTVRVSATARDGQYTTSTTGAGYNATGGTATIELAAGEVGSARLDAFGLFIEANGSAQSGQAAAGNGGTGTGGTAQLLVAAGTLISQSTLIEANGTGGISAASNTGTALISGHGLGGTALADISGGTVDPGALGIYALGSGGRFVEETAGDGEVTAISGNGTGGAATLSMSGGTLTTIDIEIDAAGIGADGMLVDSSTSGEPGGTGGTGTGGTARIAMPGGSTAVLNASAILLSANGIGGNSGGSFSGPQGIGGAALGGTARFSLADGSFDLGPTFIEAIGDGGSGDTGNPVSGGTADFLLDDSGTGAVTPRQVAGLTFNANGVPGLNSVEVPNSLPVAGLARLSVETGAASSAMTIAGDLVMNANGDVASPGTGVQVTVSGAPVTVTGNATLATSRNIAISAAATTPFDIAGTLQADALGSLTATGPIVTGGLTRIDAAGGISMTHLDSGGTTALRAITGPVGVSTNLLSTGLVTVSGTSVNLISLGALSFADADATAGNLSVQTAGNLDVITVDATGAVTLTSTGATIRNTNTIEAASIAVNAGSDFVMNRNLFSSGDIDIRAGGTFFANSFANGANITASSRDIAFDLAAGGQLFANQTLTLTNNTPANRTFIGGAAQTGGYSLDNAEVSRLAVGQRLTFTVAPGATTADFIVGNLNLSYGSEDNLAQGGELKIDTPGRVEINGAVRLQTSSATNRFSIDPTRIDVIADTGSIVMADPDGFLLGQLDLVAGTIAVADSSTLTALGSASGATAINTLLDTPTATAVDGGFLQAGTITVQATDAFYIQNSGTTADGPDRRGFSADSLAITTAGPATLISINGLVYDANGLALTGTDTAQGITINRSPASAPGLFDRFSTINGCFIGRSCKGPDTGITDPHDDIDGKLNDGFGIKTEFLPLVQVDEIPADSLMPLVDEPVTGVGNDDLWQGGCHAETGQCEEGGGEEGGGEEGGGEEGGGE